MNEQIIGGWYTQNSKIMLEEIEYALKRREIDDILFKFSFMDELSDPALISYLKIYQKRETEKLHQNELTLFSERKQKIKYFNSKYIFEYLLKVFNKKHGYRIRKKGFCYVFILLLVNCFGSGMLRLVFDQDFHGKNMEQNIGFYLYILANVILTMVVYLFFVVALTDMSRKAFLLKQLGQIISVKKDMTYRDTKYLPTINILDELSLNSWVELRKLAMDYGRKFCFRHKIFLTVIFFSGVLNLFGAISLEFIKISGDEAVLCEVKKFKVFMGVSFVTSNYMFFWLLMVAAEINIEFNRHIEILKKNNQLYLDLLFFKNFYFFNGENLDHDECFAYDSSSLVNQRSSSYVHLRLTLEIIEILGEKYKEPGVVEEYMRRLNYLNNACIEEIEDQMKFSSMKIMGFEIGRTTITNLIVIFLSVTVTCYEILYT